VGTARRAGELAMLMLRLSQGIRYDAFAQRTGHDPCELFAETIGRLAPVGLVRADADAIRLTERGVNVADAVAAEFLADG
jgi:coproporphyrinogen III oxidase-like Fe-S oxidoreductase